MISENDRKGTEKAIEAAEGRTVCCETVCSRPTMLNELSNAEIAKAFSGDIALLNGFDCIDPLIYGAEESKNPVQRAKELSGLPIGATLEASGYECRNARNTYRNLTRRVGCTV